MARLMLALFVIASMIALFCSGTFGKVSTDTLAVLKPHHITYSIIVKYMRKLRIRYMDIQQLDIHFQHFYCYYYLRNKDQYIKGGMAGESWVNVSPQLFYLGGFLSN